jgi:hypothetical protein
LQAVFQNGAIADRIQRLVIDSRQPTPLCLASLELNHFIHDMLPSARSDLRVSGGEIGAGNLQVDGGLLFGFVARMKKPLCRCPVRRA